MKKYFLILAVFLLPAIPAASQDLDLSLNGSIVSAYIWRGQELGKLSFQPSAFIQYGCVRLNGWGSLGTRNEDPQEFDLTLSFLKNNVLAGVTDYYVNGDKGYWNFQEGYNRFEAPHSENLREYSSKIFKTQRTKTIRKEKSMTLTKP